MNKLSYIIFSGLFLLMLSSYGQVVPSPAPAQTKGIVLNGATLHLGNGEIIENGTLAFANGKIVHCGGEVSDFVGYEVIDVSGKHIYPGFILPNTPLGLVEVNAVRASVDSRETGGFNPEVRSIVAYNSDSHAIPTTRTNGILTAQIAPQAGLVSGSSSIVQLDAWNWEDAVIKMDGGIHMSWPQETLGPRWWMGETNRRPNPNYKKSIEALTQTLMDGAVYAGESSPPTINLKLEAMKGLYDGSKTMFVEVNNAKAIIKSVNFLKKHGVQKIVVVGASQAWYAKDFLKAHNIPVILRDVHSLPSTTEEDVDMPYKLPALLHKEGITVCLGYRNPFSARNLPFFAGTTAGYGLSKEEALSLITSNTAKVLGVENRLGTLAIGKDATLFVSSGDALDMRTNILEHAFIEGRKIELDDKHQMLYRRYKEKYEAMKE